MAGRLLRDMAEAVGRFGLNVRRSLQLAELHGHDGNYCTIVTAVDCMAGCGLL